MVNMDIDITPEQRKALDVLFADKGGLCGYFALEAVSLAADFVKREIPTEVTTVNLQLLAARGAEQFCDALAAINLNTGENDEPVEA